MKKATQEQTKEHNTALILSTIYQGQNLSRADVARLTGLTRSTVSDIVADLLGIGLVLETGQGPSAGGKPPTFLGLAPDARHIIGIDLASGEFRGAIVNLQGEIKHRLRIPIQERSGEEALNSVYDLIDQLLAVTEQPILGIGIGAPGLMDAEQGIVRNAVNLEWVDLPLGSILEERYHLPVYIANDSQISAMAEYNFGESQRIPNLLLIKLGRGVGAGIVLNQQLFHGDGFGAGEAGHIKVEEEGELCRCGNRGCLETKISSRAIRRRARQIMADHPDSLLHQFSSDPKTLTTEQIVEAYRGGDPAVIAMIDEVGVALGKALAYLVSTLNVHRVVLAGSVSAFGEGITRPALQTLSSRVLSSLLEGTEIVTSELGEDIVVLGAAGLVLQSELGIL